MNRKIGRKPDRRSPVQKKGAKPPRNAGRIALRLWLKEEDFKLLEESTRISQRNRTWEAELLLANAIRASWAYDGVHHRDIPAVRAARDFFAGLRELQEEALKEIERAGIAARNAAAEAERRCQWWLDAGKAHRADSAAGSKVIDGKFGPAPKGSA